MHVVSMEEKEGFDYATGKPAILYRWVCTCEVRGVWLLNLTKSSSNGGAHERSHSETK
jgi:hypothetical protein